MITNSNHGGKNTKLTDHKSGDNSEDLNREGSELVDSEENFNDEGTELVSENDLNESEVLKMN